MTVRDTSLEAYRDIRESGVMGARQLQVYDHLAKAPAPITDKELSVQSGIPINVVTPRRGELNKMKLIKDVGKRPCTITTRTAHEWRVKKHPSIAEARRIKRFMNPKKAENAQRTLC